MYAVTKALIIGFLISTIKTLPFVYVFRFYYRVVKNIVIPEGKYLKNGRRNTFGITGEKDPLDLYRTASMHTYVSPLEIDMYLHKSNSTYFMDLDIARTEFMTIIFQKHFLVNILNENNEFSKKSFMNVPYIPVATVQCTFKKELKVFQRYEIVSRVFAWDEKWLFILSKFVLNDRKKTVCAIAMTKYVFKKKSRMTIRPEEILKECGFYNDEVVKVNAKHYEKIKNMRSSEDIEALDAELSHL
ncbi:Piso0_001010 [Millerozyma farinosa CBS 7064]|uniref:Piso0_001010 protein n=1 Tax=Pichia sorbitophila (strain ATCC MYA-4447 / BCRC 22081 / CBS 7064 / NBRC 10061 / NRRL Y-12695) TaxID=559304 RepID=G8YQN9_PICSO|nr:Piso0_001010 [Millerozyma farinosa CBS 7064]CCE78974.1 Piso0_001010 [Millerozyma farinosa CBS 7064]